MTKFKHAWDSRKAMVVVCSTLAGQLVTIPTQCET